MKRLVASSSILGLLVAASLHAQNGSPGPSASRTREASVPNDYRLVIGDKLRIEVYKDTQLSQSLQIRPDGKITLPLVGDIVAAGHTPAVLRDSIAASLKEYITNPVVTVTSLIQRSSRWSIAGLP